MKKYQIIKVTGLGMIESRFEYHPTRLFFYNKEKAEETANKMWLEPVKGNTEFKGNSRFVEVIE